MARYSGADDQATALRFARRSSASSARARRAPPTTASGCCLRADASARVDRAAVAGLGLPIVEPGNVDCPPGLGCESLPAPYEQYGDTPGAYGNHDLANRPSDLDIDYIVIHDTEATYDTTLQLVNDPTYVSWHYTLRSVDGHVAQHVDTQDVAWHAGNWYVNMHSIGLEHEGFAADGAAWFTESLYQSSATLVRHLSQEYGVPLDRAHIIGHDQVPGILPANVAGMHWDPGPYWDWQHYFDLLGAPLKGKLTGKAKGVVTVLPGFDDNVQPVTGCDASQPGTTPCAPQGTNFVYLYSQPSLTAPLVKDVGLHPDGSPSTTYVSDIGARATAGQQLAVAATGRDWTAVWYLGDIAWVHNPKADPVLAKSKGKVVIDDRRGRGAGLRSGLPGGGGVRPRRSRTRRCCRCSTRSSPVSRTCSPTRTSRPTTTTRRPTTAPRCRWTAPRSSERTGTTRSGSATGSPTCGRPT